MTERMKAADFASSTLKGTPESEVSKSIQDYLNKRHVYNDRLNSGMVQLVTQYKGKDGKQKEFRRWLHLCRKGTPDRFFILSGRIYFVEVKKYGKKPSPEQIATHDELRRSGAVIIIADSLKSFMRQFEEIEPLSI
jgi:hypothetical protein